MRRAALLLVIALAGTSSVHTQTATPPTRPFVETLASEKLGGREAGSADERAAGDYVAAQLARIGARPLPGRSDMFQTFAFTAGSRDAGSRVSVGTQAFSGSGVVQALSFSDDAEISGPAVFAGSGIVVSESQCLGFASFAMPDVKDYAVALLRYSP